MCSSTHPAADCSCQDTSLEVFYPEPDVVRPNGSREELAALGRALGEAAVPKDRQCTYVDCEHEAVNGHVCVRHERRIA